MMMKINNIPWLPLFVCLCCAASLLLMYRHTNRMTAAIEKSHKTDTVHVQKIDTLHTPKNYIKK